MSSSVKSIAQWQAEVSKMLPNLSRSQADGLGRLSYAMNLTGHSGLTHLCGLLADLEQRPFPQVRQRVREFYYEARAKRGNKRREVEVACCFAPLLAFVLAHWQGQKRLVLALDASQLGNRFVVLSINVLYRGGSLPVAWTLLAVGQKHSWNQEWERMLRLLSPAVGADWMVVVMADQGLYSPRLFREIQSLGWHPLMRMREDMGVRASGESDFQPGKARVNRQGRGWKGQAQWSEQGETRQGTVLVRWERGYASRWVLVTDLEPSAAQAGWYQMRFWIERGYKASKRGQFHWEQTKMTDPQRAERLWLVMAVAMLRAIVLGGQLEAQAQRQAQAHTRSAKGRAGSRSKGPQRPRRPGRPPKPQKHPRGREQSCLLRGQQALLASSLKGETLPLGAIVAPPWPTATFAGKGPDPRWHAKQLRTQQRGRAAKRQQNDRWQHAWPVKASPQEEVRLYGSSEQVASLVRKEPSAVTENPP